MDQEIIDIQRDLFMEWLKGSGLDATNHEIRVAAWNAWLASYQQHD